MHTSSFATGGLLGLRENAVLPPNGISYEAIRSSVFEGMTTVSPSIIGTRFTS